jgi:hypothetical protein
MRGDGRNSAAKPSLRSALSRLAFDLETERERERGWQWRQARSECDSCQPTVMRQAKRRALESQERSALAARICGSFITSKPNCSRDIQSWTSARARTHDNETRQWATASGLWAQQSTKARAQPTHNHHNHMRFELSCAQTDLARKRSSRPVMSVVSVAMYCCGIHIICAVPETPQTCVVQHIVAAQRCHK